MAKKLTFALLAVLMVLALAGCGGNNVTCPSGYKLQNATQNNPDGFCKNDAGNVVPVVKTSTPGMDLGRDWKDSKTPLQQAECALNTTADICK